MSSQALTHLRVIYDVCPHCRQMANLLHLTLEVCDHKNSCRERSWVGCGTCSSRMVSVVLQEDLRVGDVLDLPTKHYKRAQNKKARKREYQAAEDIGGQRVPGSGSDVAKGDARNEAWMVEDKHTSGRSYRLTREVISKAVGQASRTGRKAVVRVGLVDGTNLAVCLWEDFREVISE